MTPSPSPRRSCTLLALFLLGLTTGAVGQNVIPDEGTEIVEARTERSRHLLMPDGTRRAMIHAGPIHYRADGRWEPIDLTVRPTGRPDKPYAVRANRFETWFGATVAHGVQMEHGSVRITDWKDLAWVETDGSGAVVRRIPADLSGAMTHENQVIVPGIFPGVRAELTISTSGKKVDYILTDDTLVHSAPPSAVHVGIRERMVLRGMQMAETPQGPTSGPLTLVGPDSEPVAQLRRPVAYDASVPYHSEDDPARPVIDMAYVVVPVDAHTLDLTTRLSLDWLADTARVLPITLDPTLDFVTSGANSTGFVNDNDDCEPVGGTFTGTADPQTDIVYGWFDGFQNFYYDGYGSFDISGFAPYLNCVQVNSVTYNWRVHYQFQSCGDPVILKFGRTENNNNPQVGWPGGGNNCGSRRAWIENNNQRYRGGGKNGIGLQNATGIPANFISAAGSPAGRINMGWSYDGGDDGCTFLSGGDDSEYYCIFGHNQGANAPFVTVDYTYNTPTLTADVQQVCSGQTSNVTFNFAGSGCTYRLYDGPRPSGSLLTATTSSTHTPKRSL